ncbi:protein of unknown function (DU1801) [Sphaerochaeta pleomorpha str. Grapes]|uniref:YdhG-like domain-containing protein n=1 Tax=Sphaerochaeta pleomorpha (strain ATCC BAA-1885 / DSM 22778 / Grapes) TaxID=158190 RepID=G8QRR0_SPHPG|nr:DUF1801 domain-containing protein [Sphaerochaeta pleomorpha]AEV28843.1 protein of unknown function (DU1801) [Sphaerochaeta pleomorpha str. Grapes]
MHSDATTVDEYLASQLPVQKEVLSSVREFILAHIPSGIEENIRWGMITYEVPIKRNPSTYNRQPLMYAALSAQKHHCSLYLTAAYLSEENTKLIVEGFAKAGKKLNMGKSCIRFKTVEDLALDVIASILISYTVDSFLEASKKAHILR